MKYTININQYAAVKHFGNKLDLVDLAILEYFKDLYCSQNSKIKHMTGKDGKVFVWMAYGELIRQMPLIGIKTKRGLIRRLEKLVNLDLLEKYTATRTEAKYTYFAQGEAYDCLNFVMNGNSTPSPEKAEKERVMNGRSTPLGTGVQHPAPMVMNGRSHNYSTIRDSYTKDSFTSPAQPDRDQPANFRLPGAPSASLFGKPSELPIDKEGEKNRQGDQGEQQDGARAVKTVPVLDPAGCYKDKNGNEYHRGTA